MDEYLKFSAKLFGLLWLCIAVVLYVFYSDSIESILICVGLSQFWLFWGSLQDTLVTLKSIEKMGAIEIENNENNNNNDRENGSEIVNE